MQKGEHNRIGREIGGFSPELLQEARSVGVEDVFAKPFAFDVVTQQVQALLEQSPR